MSFKIFLKEQKQDELIRAQSRGSEEVGIEHFYGVLLKEDWKDKLAAYKNKVFGKRAEMMFPLKEIVLLGEETIFVKTVDFNLGLRTAIKYFSKNLKKFKINQLGWARIYHYTAEGSESPPEQRAHRVARPGSRFPSSKMTRQVAEGFKFFINPRKDPIFQNFQLSLYGNHQINLNNYLLKKTESDGDYIKLISLIDNDVQLTQEVLYNFCEELSVLVNRTIVQQILNNKNNWVHVGTRVKRTVTNPKYKIYTNEDKSELYLKLEVSKGAHVNFTLQDLSQILEDRQIDVAVIEKTATAYLAGTDFSKPVLLAKGTPVLHGRDAYIEEVAYEKHLEKNKEAMESAQQSHKSHKGHKGLSHFITIGEGEIIAQKHSLHVGSDGLDIYNNVIPAEVAHDIEFKGGKNTELSQDSLTLTATKSGNLYRDSNQLWTVEDVLHIENVDSKSGNITHLGTVIVGDSISDGYSVVTSGNVYVHGSVGVASIEAGGDVILNKGVNGKNKASIISHFGNVRAKYLQDVAVTTEGNVVVEELISNCIINAGDKIEVLKRRGTVWGGVIKATKSIVVSNIGSVSGRKTNLEVGVPFQLRIRLSDCQREIEHTKKLILTLQNQLQKTAGQGQGHDFTKIRTDLKKYNTALKKNESEQQHILEDFEENYVPCHVTAKHYVYANSTIKCQAAVIHNKRYRNSLVFSAEQDNPKNIHVEPYIFKENEKQFYL